MEHDPDKKEISPASLAKALDITEPELFSALGYCSSFLQHQPPDQELQRCLGELTEVFERLLELRQDPAMAALQLGSTRVRVLDNLTLLETVRDHDVRKALRYLQSISGGQNG